MKYCKKCVIPDTRPHIELDSSGVCNACRANATKKNIDWTSREKAFRSVVKNAQERASGYDCLIPVSGGKDSTWQVIQCLEYGLRPLAVTWKTPARTELGTLNLENLIRLGVDHIDYQISPKLEAKFMWKTLDRFGSTAIPMHMAMFNIPLNLAVKLDIPLVVWGENSAFEYGGTEEEWTGFKLDGTWLKKFGVTHGTTAMDWVDSEMSAKDLSAYFGPTDRELEEKRIQAIFMGYYFEWDPEKNLRIALNHGFKISESGPKTGYYNYASIDCDFIAIHHYLKWYKFGITRLFDNLAVEIRNGRITREQAVEAIREAGAQVPLEDIQKFCQFVGKSENDFFQLIEKFRNLDIWKKNDGVFKIKEFLIEDQNWKGWRL